MNIIGSLIGLALVEKSGRRKLTLRSLFAVSLVLAGIAVAFYEAEHQSPAVDMNSLGKDSQASTCNSYEWCFDCTQDENCGYCSYYITGFVPVLCICATVYREYMLNFHELVNLLSTFLFLYG